MQTHEFIKKGAYVDKDMCRGRGGSLEKRRLRQKRFTSNKLNPDREKVSLPALGRSL